MRDESDGERHVSVGKDVKLSSFRRLEGRRPRIVKLFPCS